MHVLVIEDDATILKSIKQGLVESGYSCDTAGTGTAGLQLAADRQPDVIILDLMLPGMRGQDVLRELRAQGIQTPVIVLTALGAVEDRVAGLEMGADDYLVKPFAMAELKARIEAVARRVMARPPSHVEVDDVSLDLTNRRVTRGDRDVDLTPTEFSVLELLMRYAGQVVTRSMLCEHVWGFTWDGNTNVLEVHINRLRRKLDAGRNDSFIQTIRGRGYAIRAT